MNFVKFLCFSFLFTAGIQASTHWMVTESGLIQPKLDTPFEMARPYDLLAFLNQDTHWESTINTYHDLHKKQEIIDKLWEQLQEETDVSVQTAKDKNCVKAGSLNMLDWYASFLEDGKSKKVAAKDFAIYNPAYGQDKKVPDCKKISSLTFSMFAFEHLQGVKQRENLTSSPELSMPEQISSIMTVEQFGHWLAFVLRKNSSSWLHYNMASLYWRIRGNAPKAMECCRRAVHYAPRIYKDVALLSMGTLLHRTRMTEDAIAVLGAAVDHDRRFPVHHFILANAYAVLGDFNNSIKHYDYSLKIDSSFEMATKHKYAVLCYSYLLKIMDVVQGILNKLREELIEYSRQESDWLKIQAAFLKNMKHSEEFDYRNVDANCEKMEELTKLNIKELKKRGDKNSLILYFLEGPMYSDKWLVEKGVHLLDSAYNLQRLVKHIDKHTSMVSGRLLQPDQKMVDERTQSVPSSPDKSTGILHESKETKKDSYQTVIDKESRRRDEVDFFDFEGGIVLYPPTMKISRNSEDFDRDPDWPSNRICKKNAAHFPKNLEAIFPIFMPFENKGIRLRSLLSDKLGVPYDVEHDLPWHPPTCPQDKEVAAFTHKKSQRQHFASEVVNTGYLRQKLLEYVGDGGVELVKHMQDAEIGHRIYAAMQLRVVPAWLIYTLSSLYWRVRSNNVNALNCLLTSSRTVEGRYRDIVLVSLASVYLEMGYFEEALVAAEEAFRLSLYEPATNFILSELNMIKKHRNTHMFHLKQVIRVEPRFMNGLARNLLEGWACILKQVDIPQKLDLGDGDVCTQVEPGTSMVCEKDGNSCHITNIHCFSSRDKGG